MNDIYLTSAEKDEMAKWLSRRATAGGWFFMGMIGFIFLMVMLAFYSANRHQNQPVYSSDDIGVFFTLILILAGIGLWLLRRRVHIRRLLDEPLTLGNGRILDQHRVPYTGFRLKLQITTAAGESYETRLGYLGLPDWQIGDELELIFWQNGRFCPRHIDHIVDFGHLPTPERKQRIRKRIIWFVVGYAIFVAIAILLGLYSQSLK